MLAGDQRIERDGSCWVCTKKATHWLQRATTHYAMCEKHAEMAASGSSYGQVIPMEHVPDEEGANW